MGWVIFTVLAWSTTLILVPLKHWKKAWSIGIFALAGIYVIDSTLVDLGAFWFKYGSAYLSGLPLFYWISYFPGGVMFDYYKPDKHIWKLLYILFWAAGYLAIELIMIHFDYFRHLDWSAFKAFLLNVLGFTMSMWFAEWMEEGRKHGAAKKDF